MDQHTPNIVHASNSKDLEMMMYRALPAFYESIGAPLEDASKIMLHLKLVRQQDSWQLWFNIEAPDAIRVLGLFNPHMFRRMSGGKDQASSIVKNDYSVGFSKNTKTFELEPFFIEQEKRLYDSLNAASSESEWWSVFFKELPWSYAKTRGWVNPSEKQWEQSQNIAQRFQREFQEFLLSKAMPRAPLGKMTWSTNNTFSDCVGFNFYPLLSQHPLIALSSAGVRGHYIDSIDFDQSAATLNSIIANCATVSKALYGKNIFAYQLRDLIASTADNHAVDSANALYEAPTF